MRTAITAIVIAGLTTAARAQNVGTVTLTTSDTTVSVGESITIGIVLSDNISGESVFYFDVMVEGSGASFSTVPDSLIVDPGMSGFVFAPGFVGGVKPTGALGAGGSIDILGPTLDAPLDNLAVFSFRVLATETGLITFDPSDGPLDRGPRERPALEWFQNGIVPTPTAYDEYVFEPITITVIPAPSNLILISLAAPLTARRRR